MLDLCKKIAVALAFLSRVTHSAGIDAKRHL